MKKREAKLQHKFDEKIKKAAGRSPKKSPMVMKYEETKQSGRQSVQADDSWGEPADSASPQKNQQKLTFREKPTKAAPK